MSRKEVVASAESSPLHDAHVLTSSDPLRATVSRIHRRASVRWSSGMMRDGRGRRAHNTMPSCTRLARKSSRHSDRSVTPVKTFTSRGASGCWRIPCTIAWLMASRSSNGRRSLGCTGSKSSSKSTSLGALSFSGRSSCRAMEPNRIATRRLGCDVITDRTIASTCAALTSSSHGVIAPIGTRSITGWEVAMLRGASAECEPDRAGLLGVTGLPMCGSPAKDIRPR